MVLRPQQLTGLRQTSWLRCIYKNGRGFDFSTINQQVGIHTSFHPFTKIGQIFHDKYIFNNDRTFQVEICKMVWTNILFFQFLSIRCALNKSETWERELPKKKFSQSYIPPGSPRSLLPQPLINRKSFSIYTRSSPDQLGTNPASGHGGT